MQLYWKNTMSKMMSDFNPYDLLIQLDIRYNHLEKAHNKLADAFQQSEQELTIALHSVKQLQQIVAQLQNRVKVLSVEQANMNKNINDINH